jgi:hypothetical protein
MSAQLRSWIVLDCGQVHMSWDDADDSSLLKKVHKPSSDSGSRGGKGSGLAHRLIRVQGLGFIPGLEINVQDISLTEAHALSPPDLPPACRPRVDKHGFVLAPQSLACGACQWSHELSCAAQNSIHTSRDTITPKTGLLRGHRQVCQHLFHNLQGLRFRVWGVGVRVYKKA